MCHEIKEESPLFVFFALILYLFAERLFSSGAVA